MLVSKFVGVSLINDMVEVVEDRYCNKDGSIKNIDYRVEFVVTDGVDDLGLWVYAKKIYHSYQFNNTNDPQNDDDVDIDAYEVISTEKEYDIFVTAQVWDNQGTDIDGHRGELDLSIVEQINQILIEQAEEEFKKDKGL